VFCANLREFAEKRKNLLLGGHGKYATFVPTPKPSNALFQGVP
jgi:hypothetical protein